MNFLCFFFFFGGALRLATFNRVSLASQLKGRDFHPAFVRHEFLIM